MNRRKQNKINISYLIIFVILIVFVIILIAITNMINGSNKVEYKENLSTEINVYSGNDINIIANKDDSETERLEVMTERARIEYYVTKFLNYIEGEKYQEAYELLNDTYKKDYFPSLDSFKKYVKSNFFKMMDIDYTNFERIGDTYVIWMTVTDAINGGPNSGKEINFVVKENGYNDYELSFSAN